MWSPSFVPKPKDWPSYVDVVGTFFDNTGSAALTNGPSPAAAAQGRFSSKKPSIKAGYAEVASGATADGAVPTPQTVETSTASSPTPSVAVSPVVESQFKPPEALLQFLESGPPPIFVGFGSMVVKDLEGLISKFLEGAALVGVRIIVQLGWSEISNQRFLELALQAQLRASMVHDAEDFNDRLCKSVIFPSAPAVGLGEGSIPGSSAFSTAAALAKAGLTPGVPGIGQISSEQGSMVDLAMSVRSVESSSPAEEVESNPDDSTLDGEGLLSGISTGMGRDGSVGIASNMYTSSITATSAPQSVSKVSDKTSTNTEDREFDSSPISTPERPSGRHKSGDRGSRLSGGVAAEDAESGKGSGLGKWLLGAAASLKKSLTSGSVSLALRCSALVCSFRV
jgi:hypothetical protein